MGQIGVNHCFPLNGDYSSPEIKGVEGIMLAYREKIQWIQLYGPTLFGPILSNLFESLKNIPVESKNYNVFLILTDGQINDMGDTKRLLVQLSYFPVSIIIIGVGNADFSMMEELDSDNSVLTD